MSDYNLPVIIGELSLPPMPNAQDYYTIAFTFDQVGDWTFDVAGV